MVHVYFTMIDFSLSFDNIKSEHRSCLFPLCLKGCSQKHPAALIQVGHFLFFPKRKPLQRNRMNKPVEANSPTPSTQHSLSL